jgi:hypothetical protein
MVAGKELKGCQLYTEKKLEIGLYSSLSKGIPTFILIDPKGNIVSASAIRPSNPELRVLFDVLLK